MTMEETLPITERVSLVVPEAGVVIGARALQLRLNEREANHREELSWLRMELDTTRREKQAVEDRMSELYRNMQDIQERDKPNDANSVQVSSDPVMPLQHQLDKYERIVRVMNNQIALVRSSSDSVVRSLKDEISDLMDEKCRVELELMNQVTNLECDKKELLLRLDSGNGSSDELDVSAETVIGEVMESDDHRARSIRLAIDNAKLKRQVLEEQDISKARETEKSSLLERITNLQDEVTLLRSSAAGLQTLDQLKENRQETITALERLAFLWDRVDQAMQLMDSKIREFRDQGPIDSRNQIRPSSSALTSERVLSSMETGALVYGQLQVSLMLIELKLRNNLVDLNNEGSSQAATLSPLPDASLHSQVKMVQIEAMTAIDQVEQIVKEQVQQLEEQSKNETNVTRKALEDKASEFESLQKRHLALQTQVDNLKPEHINVATELKDEHTMELLVSQSVMDQLQVEVLQVVKHIRSKNKKIDELTVLIDAQKSREQTLLNELKRFAKKQKESTGKAKRQPESEEEARTVGFNEIDRDHEAEVGEDET